MRREDFPILLKNLGLNTRGAEVGVDTGIFSTVLISAGFNLFFSIDNWSSGVFDTLDKEGNPSSRPAEHNYDLAKERLSIFGERSKVLRMSSQEASEMFRNHYFDFVYIDADHRYEAVRQDLMLWYSKVRPGGIIAGHDYRDGAVDWESGLRSYYGVKQAVDEFFNDKKLEIKTTDEPDWKSWYVHKSYEHANP